MTMVRKSTDSEILTPYSTVHTYKTLGMKKPLLYIKPASHLPETAATAQLYFDLTLPAQPLSPPPQLPHPARASGGREERYEVSTTQGRRKRGKEKTRERKNA